MDIRIEIPIMDDTMESGIFINFLGYKNNNVFSHRECLEDLLFDNGLEEAFSRIRL
ncbi:MAG: hypothetical protein QXR21_00495 [Thermoplasmatales archaeon]